MSSSSFMITVLITVMIPVLINEAQATIRMPIIASFYRSLNAWNSKPELKQMHLNKANYLNKANNVFSNLCRDFQNTNHYRKLKSSRKRNSLGQSKLIRAALVILPGVCILIYLYRCIYLYEPVCACAYAYKEHGTPSHAVVREFCCSGQGVLLQWSGSSVAVVREICHPRAYLQDQQPRVQFGACLAPIRLCVYAPMNLCTYAFMHL